ncbi:hypothetical protein NliqN6_2435 [Naganishia liquefaciens]|uniref:C2H2-type domain-containing protein n=1 Tax=Naganishia liquefaciens TaxID=104408 RepID=A0A8H3TRU5_9TREE|nr:hypothetical protein NliqN6_2435 [Naganishia liquefaciens]
MTNPPSAFRIEPNRIAYKIKQLIMPAKKKCQAQIVISSPSLPAAKHTITSPTLNPASLDESAPRSPGGTLITKDLPATEASEVTMKCPHPAVRIVGDCSFCGKSFCGNHRLPEHHTCVHLQACRDAAHAANKAKLEAEKTTARKVAST